MSWNQGWERTVAGPVHAGVESLGAPGPEGPRQPVEVAPVITLLYLNICFYEEETENLLSWAIKAKKTCIMTTSRFSNFFLPLSFQS